MPEIITGQDGSAVAEAAAVESAKVETARAELYDEATGSESGVADSGELILGKYRSTEDLAAAYQSLQAEYSRLTGGQQQAQSEAEEPPQADTQGEAVESQAKPLDASAIEALTAVVMEQVGGEAEYRRLATWAAANLPPDRTNAYNAALESGDTAAVLNSLKGLQYDYMMKNGYEPRLAGGRAPSNEVRGFQSEAQVVEAMKDPRYSGDNPDPAYIKEVERRIAVSNVFQSR